MSTPIESLFKPEELKAARTQVLDEEVKQLQVFARRADTPQKRVALSELEQRVMLWRQELAEAGLVEPQAA